MAVTLSNPHLHFSLNPAASTWSLYPQKTETPAIDGARFNGHFRFSDLNWTHLGGLRLWQWRGRLDEADISTRSQTDSPHGPLDLVVARLRSGHDSLAITAEFALPQTRPFLLIRFLIRNVGRQPFRVARLNPLFVGALHNTGAVRLTSDIEPLTFFSNGWQSWSFAGALTANRAQPYTNLGPIQEPVNYSPFTPFTSVKGQFSGDMFGVLACPSRRSAIVAGFISQREQFGSVDVVTNPAMPSLRLRAQCDDVIMPPGGELQTDWAYVQLISDYDLDPLRDYAEAVARENNAHVPAQTPVGWCSWYHYFSNVTEENIRANLDQVAKDRSRIPLTHFQLDDGFESNIGDWFTLNSKFPSGLRALSDSIRAHDLTPGLWLAPFIAKPDSHLARQHPDWLVKNALGLPASAGFIFNSFGHALDLTQPDAQEHTRQLISAAVNEWGYPYLKLDFLYAAAIRGRRHHPTRTRAQVMRLGLELIRGAAGPNTFILGCGCPLGSAVGLVDAMRISADVDVGWRPRYGNLSFPFYNEPCMPAARNAIRNTLTRAPLHRRWWLNDPDCLLVRDSTRLTRAEVIALATVIALSGGLLVLSDDLPTLSPERRKLIEPLLPIIGKTAFARDWLETEMPEALELPLSGAAGDWKVFGIFNWADSPANRSLPVDTDSHIFDFWNQAYFRSFQPLTLSDLPPHSARLFAVRPVIAGVQFVGSSLHFSQGAEIAEWHGTENSLRFVINLNRAADGYVTIASPRSSPGAETEAKVKTDSIPTPAARIADGLYRFPVAVNHRAEVIVEW